MADVGHVYRNVWTSLTIDDANIRENEEYKNQKTIIVQQKMDISARLVINMAPAPSGERSVTIAWLETLPICP